MYKRLEAQQYLWNSFCEKLVYENLSVSKSISNEYDYNLFVKTYNKCIKLSTKILAIFETLIQLKHRNELQEDFYIEQMYNIKTISNEIDSLYFDEEFARVRAKYIDKSI